MIADGIDKVGRSGNEVDGDLGSLVTLLALEISVSCISGTGEKDEEDDPDGCGHHLLLCLLCVELFLSRAVKSHNDWGTVIVSLVEDNRLIVRLAVLDLSYYGHDSLLRCPCSQRVFIRYCSLGRIDGLGSLSGLFGRRGLCGGCCRSVAACNRSCTSAIVGCRSSRLGRSSGRTVIGV